MLVRLPHKSGEHYSFVRRGPRPHEINMDSPLAPTQTASLSDLFLAFAGVSLRSFGGVLPFARRLIVEERRWLTSSEFTDVLGFCQFLPGPNVVNVSIVLGRRLRGVRGAIAASLGLILPSFAVALCLAFGYERYAGSPLVARAFRGINLAAAGLIVAVAVKAMAGLGKHRLGWPLMVFVCTAVVFLHWPLVLILLAVTPASVAVVWWRRK